MLLGERKLQRVASYRDAAVKIFAGAQQGMPGDAVSRHTLFSEWTSKKLLLKIWTIHGTLIIRGGNHTVIKHPSKLA